MAFASLGENPERYVTLRGRFPSVRFLFHFFFIFFLIKKRNKKINGNPRRMLRTVRFPKRNALLLLREKQFRLKTHLSLWNPRRSEERRVGKEWRSSRWREMLKV